MNLCVCVKFVYAASGNCFSETYYPSSIEDLNSLVSYFNAQVSGGLFSSWNLVSVNEEH